jgi:hypothetical protein
MFGTVDSWIIYNLTGAIGCARRRLLLFVPPSLSLSLPATLLSSHRPILFALSCSPRPTFSHSPDTGGVQSGVHVTDVTNASRTMLMNIHTLKWDPELYKCVSAFASLRSDICA